MNVNERIEQALTAVVPASPGRGCPPGLAAAMHYAVFPGGARVRPRLCLAVAAACGDPEPRLSEGAAVAIELLHCASLVHDDLPCFDDAPVRRGKPRSTVPSVNGWRSWQATHSSSRHSVRWAPARRGRPTGSSHCSTR